MPLESTQSNNEAIADLKKKLSGFETEEGRLSGLSYKPKSKDEVLITTTPKAGTTWLQQICHQLRSAPNGGDMSFSEISEVVPWLELAFDQGQDLNAPQYGDSDGIPRIFKTHAWAGHCPTGCKKIVVLRDPMDVLLSFYKFFENWFFEEGTLSLDSFAQEFWLARGVPTSRMNNASYFVHLVSWYERRHDPDVLLLCYEDLKDNLKPQVRRIARFISTDQHEFDQPGYVALATERASYAYMKEHQSQFDEKLSKMTRNEACGLPKSAGMQQTKLNQGRVGRGKLVLSTKLQEAVRAKWEQVVQPVTGCSNYQQLRESLRN